MAAGNDTKVQKAIRSWKLGIDKQYPHLSAEERNAILQQQMYKMFPELYTSSTAFVPTSSVPQKRQSGLTQLESERRPKRTAAASASPPSPTYLQRHISAPAGSTVLPSIREPTQTRPINIPQNPHKHLGQYQPSLNMYTSPHSSIVQGGLQFNNQIRDLSPSAYLAQPDLLWTTSAYSSTAPEFGQGKLYDFNNSNLFDSDCTYSFATTTSSSSMTSASPGEAMTRTNTCDPVYDPFAMLRVDSERSLAESTGIMTDSYTGYSPQLDDVETMQFPFVSISKSPLSSNSTRLKPQTSKETGLLSTSSESSQSFSSMPQIDYDQNSQPKVQRVLAPKKNDNDSKYGPAPKIVAIRGADGTYRPKAEIPRAARQPQQRKTTFCDFCNDQPQGFHGDHELRRHIERQHTQIRKVWICRDISEGGQFLRNCKACRNQKTYGANYNAAAHLRRTHFNPCKNKRGGRNKKSEGRGGMGGGNSPSMDELKNWMFETYEFNSNGRVIVQNIAPDPSIPQVPLSDLPGLDSSDNLHADFDTDCVYPPELPGAENVSYQEMYGTTTAFQQPSMVGYHPTQLSDMPQYSNNQHTSMNMSQYYGRHYRSG